MKKKQKVDIANALCLILIGTILLVIPMFSFKNIYVLTIIIYGLYTILGSIRFLLVKETKDYEGLHTALSSLIPLIMTIIIKPENPRHLALILCIWIICMAMTKLKKIDYYHDRRDRMWKVRAFILGLFLLAGILTSINLAHTSEIQIIVFGFFMLIHGILELFDPILKTLITHS